METWKHNSEIISIDDTYKTNRFNLPLMQLTGITGLGTTYNIAWALLKNEREESYQWVLSRMRTMAEQREIPLPMVMISDYDTALRSAFNNIFPGCPRNFVCGTS